MFSKNIPFVAQPTLPIYYKGEPLQQVYRPDFVCYQEIILELKSAKDLTKEHEAQILNYLKASQKKVGLLVNFGSYPKANVKRFVLSANSHHS